MLLPQWKVETSKTCLNLLLFYSFYSIFQFFIKSCLHCICLVFFDSCSVHFIGRYKIDHKNDSCLGLKTVKIWLFFQRAKNYKSIIIWQRQNNDHIENFIILKIIATSPSFIEVYCTVYTAQFFEIIISQQKYCSFVIWLYIL